MKKRYGAEQIVVMLRQADVELGKGLKVPDVCRALGISEQTYYRWRQKYGGMAPDMARQLKALEKENGRLKRLVADQALDIQILKEAIMVEPTETESKEMMDAFAEAMLEVARQVRENPQAVRAAPVTTPVSRLDMTAAERQMDFGV